MIECPKCNYENRENARFCHRCGEALPSPNPSPSEASQRPTQPLIPSSALDLPTTHPLPAATMVFAPLPEGALLRDGRYAVEEIRDTNEQVNVYLVEENVPVRLCPNCRSEVVDPEERFCFECGADVSEIEPIFLRYLVHESADEEAFAAEAQLLSMRLDHDSLLMPYDVFVETPYGPTRQYLVKPEFSPPTATALAIPQQVNRVLEWGVTLAQGMDYLHRHQVALREINLQQIAIEGKHAYWTHLDGAHVIPPEARPQAKQYFTQDVHKLAAALYFLATGEQQTDQIDLPDEVAMLFSQALTNPEGLTAASLATTLEESLQNLRHPASVTHVIGSRTDVGQERTLNEDSLLALDSATVFRSISTPVGLFAVADGMGGHEAGDVASRLAIQSIAQQAASEILTSTGTEILSDVRQWLTDATMKANQSVHDHRKLAGTDMGTTLVMALLIGDKATIANVGDSRAYLLKVDGMTQITVDHSLVERLVATGQITRQEALHHPQKNVIYRVIGDKSRTEVDLFPVQLAPGEALLLCSDGLNGMVSDEHMWQIWQGSASPQEACNRLVEAANEAGGEDNITVVIVQVQD